MDTTAAIEKTEIIFAVESRKGHFSVAIGPEATVADFIQLLARDGHVDEGADLYLEDSERPLERHLLLVKHLSATFAPLHAASRGLIKTTVEYNNTSVTRDFAPSTTIARIIQWAISPDGLRLEGGPADYQLKVNGIVLSPDEHLGQLAEKHKAVHLDLVFKVKPQG